MRDSETNTDHMSDAERNSVYEAARLVDQARNLLSRAIAMAPFTHGDEIVDAVHCLPDTDAMRRIAEKEHAQ